MNPTSRLRKCASSWSLFPARSSPSKHTAPLVGRSSVPTMCNNVLFPTPDSPTIATRSPAAISRSRSVRTRTTRGPSTYSLVKWRSAIKWRLFVADHLHGRQTRRLTRRVDGREEADQHRSARDERKVLAVDPHRQRRDVEHVLRKLDELIAGEQPTAGVAAEHAEQRPDGADDHTLQHEDARDAAIGRPHAL